MYVETQLYAYPLLVQLLSLIRTHQFNTHTCSDWSPGGSWYTTYTRVPHYLTSHLRSLVLQSLEYTVFDMQQDDAIVIEIQSHTLAGRIISGLSQPFCGPLLAASCASLHNGMYKNLITGNSPLEIITSYTAYSGRMSALPKWVGQGATLGLQGGTQVGLLYTHYLSSNLSCAHCAPQSLWRPRARVHFISLYVRAWMSMCTLCTTEPILYHYCSLCWTRWHWWRSSGEI